MRLALWIPTTDLKYVDEIASTLCNDFGGCTVYPATGYWRNEASNSLEREPVHVLEVFVLGSDKPWAKRAIVKAARRVKKDLKQDSVMYAIDGNPEFLAIRPYRLIARSSRELP